MKPGFELNNLVALHIFGITSTNGWVDTKAMIETNKGRDYIPKYSEEIAAAWEVVEKMKEEGYDWEIYSFRDKDAGCDWRVFCRGFDSYETTAPLGICLAALKAKGVEI